MAEALIIKTNIPLHKVALPVSILVAFMGAVVITGWHLKLPALLQIHPSFTPMQYNTALGFLLSGLALLFYLLSQLQLSRVLAAGVLLIGVLTGLQMLLGLDFHIDQLFMDHYIMVKTVSLGRMAPNTALCFVLISVSLLLASAPLSTNVRAIATAVLSPIIIAFALISLLGGYVFGAAAALGWGSLTGMAVHTSAGFLVLGLSSFSLQPNGVQRNFLPSMAIALLVSTLGIWMALEAEGVALQQHYITQQTQQLRNDAQVKLKEQRLALERMALRRQQSDVISEIEGKSDAQGYIDDLGFLFIGYYGRDPRLMWTAGNQTIASVLTSPLPIDQCRNLYSPTNQLIYHLTTAEPLLLEMLPLRHNNQPDGCLLAISSWTQFFTVIRRHQVAPYPLSVFIAEQPIIQEPSDGIWHTKEKLNAEEFDIGIQITPTEAQLNVSNKPEIVLASGLVLSALTLFAFFWVGVARRHAAESEALGREVQSESSFRQQVIEHAPYGILLSDSDGAIQLVNDSLRRLLGYESDELIGEPIETLVPKNLRNKHTHKRKDYTNNQQSARRMAPSLQVLGQHKDGHHIPIEVSLATFGEGANSRVIAIIIDVSERNDAQRQIETQLKELTSVNAELDNFAYVASHDLKSPLRGIEQIASWIEEDLSDSLDPDTQENLHHMRSRIKRMGALLDDLLDYSRAGREKGELIQVDTQDLVNSVFDLAANEKGIRLQTTEKMPTLQTHRTPLEMVFRNLITNAIKHHDKPRGLISISAITTDEGTEFSVTDDGPGIIPEHQQRVFAMFQTLKPRDEVEGSGMGLALVKKIIESFGGWVTLESDGSCGCTFRFLWPATIVTRN